MGISGAFVSAVSTACADTGSKDTHKKKHSKSSLVLSLTKIEGIGEKKAALLLKEMKTLSHIKEASAEKLSAIKGKSVRDAENIYNYFHTEV